MKAVVYEGTRKVGVHEVEDAVIEDPADVVVRVTSSAICGTDLHMYDGRTGAEPGLVIGHEPLGVIERAGSEVSLVKPGDRVVIPTHLYCGMCFNCVRGYTAACLRVRPEGFGAAYGYAGMGTYRGAQAELLRVPFADANCIRVPGSPLDEREDDFVLLADAFVTGWHATELAFMQPGCTVAVFGAGTIGLLAAYSALLRGAAEVYVVDHIADRLDMAGSLGATPVSFGDGDPVEQIRELRRRRGLPIGEEQMNGVQKGIDRSGSRPGTGPTRPGRTRLRWFPTWRGWSTRPGTSRSPGSTRRRTFIPLQREARTGRCGCRGPRSSARASTSGSGGPTTGATPPCCGTWWWPGGRGPGRSSLTTGRWPTRLRSTTASTGALTA